MKKFEEHDIREIQQMLKLIPNNLLITTEDLIKIFSQEEKKDEY